MYLSTDVTVYRYITVLVRVLLLIEFLNLEVEASLGGESERGVLDKKNDFERRNKMDFSGTGFCTGRTLY